MQTTERRTGGWRKGRRTVPVALLGILLAGALLLLGCQGSPQGGAPAPEEKPVEAVSEESEAAVEEPEGPKAPEVTVDEAKQAFEKKSALFLDARSPEVYAKGHFPGALNLFNEKFEDYYPLLEDQIKSAERVIAYCDGVECGRAPEIAGRLLELVDVPVFVFTEGYPAWTKAGLPTKTGPEP